jgi:uncharacterized protein YbjT (DUF2867 family)
MVEGDLKDRASIKKALHGITTIISTASSTFSRQDGDSIQTVDNEGQANLVDAKQSLPAFNTIIYISFPSMPGEFPLQDAKRRVEKKLVVQQHAIHHSATNLFCRSLVKPCGWI